MTLSKNAQKLAQIGLVLLYTSLAQIASASIHDLSWISGHWTGTYKGLSIEAQYSSSNGNLILGSTKMVNPQEKVAFYEFEEIAQDGNNMILRALPFGKPGADFPMKEQSRNRVVFENLNHDFPTRIIYELKSDGMLLARIEGKLNGQPHFEEFMFLKEK